DKSRAANTQARALAGQATASDRRHRRPPTNPGRKIGHARAPAPSRESMMDLETSIRNLLERFTDVGGLDDPLELSSLDFVDLTASLEEQFSIEVRGKEVVPDNFSTLRRVIAFVEQKRQPQPA